MLTVTPETWTGVKHREGSRWPVRPTFQTILLSFVVAVDGRNFHAITQRGSRPATPSLALKPRSSTLHDHAVDLEVERLAAAPPPAAALGDLVDP